MYEIREYNEKDKDQVIKLWVDVCVEEHGFYEWKKDLLSFHEADYEKILVAVFENKVIGTMAYKKINNEIAELKRVYIYPNYRGQGISKKLYNAILDIIYPPEEKCIVCGIDGFIGLCPQCKNSIKRATKKENSLSYGFYGGVIKNLILKFKYEKGARPKVLSLLLK